MKRTSPNTTLVALAVLLLAISLLAGCMGRKRIDPNQGRPAMAPAPVAKKAPAKKPVIETTVDGDSAKPAIPKSARSTVEPPVVTDDSATTSGKVIETTLPGEGKAPAKPIETTTAPKAAAPKTADVVKSVETKKKPPVAVDKELHYVQVGVFSNKASAERILADLIADGYKDSRLKETDTGLYKVQAGAFEDNASAKEALAKLKAKYPGSFIAGK